MRTVRFASLMASVLSLLSSEPTFLFFRRTQTNLSYTQTDWYLYSAIFTILIITLLYYYIISHMAYLIFNFLRIIIIKYHECIYYHKMVTCHKFVEAIVLLKQFPLIQSLSFILYSLFSSSLQAYKSYYLTIFLRTP